MLILFINKGYNIKQKKYKTQNNMKRIKNFSKQNKKYPQDSLDEYFESLSIVYNVPLDIVKEFAETFGESEYFDALVSALIIYNNIDDELAEELNLKESQSKSNLDLIEYLSNETFLSTSDKRFNFCKN